MINLGKSWQFKKNEKTDEDFVIWLLGQGNRYEQMNTRDVKEIHKQCIFIRVLALVRILKTYGF